MTIVNRNKDFEYEVRMLAPDGNEARYEATCDLKYFFHEGISTLVATEPVGADGRPTNPPEAYLIKSADIIIRKLATEKIFVNYMFIVLPPPAGKSTKIWQVHNDGSKTKVAALELLENFIGLPIS